MVASRPANHCTTPAPTNRISAQSNPPRFILGLPRDSWSNQPGHMSIFPHPFHLLGDEAIQSLLGYEIWDCTDFEVGRNSFHPPCLVSAIHKWRCSFATSGRLM